MFDLPSFWLAVGVAGDITVLGVYLLLQAGKLSSDGYPYLIWNVIGSSGIILGFMAEWRLADFLVELSWLGISIGAIVNLLWTKYQSHRSRSSKMVTVLTVPSSSSIKSEATTHSLSA